MPSNYFGRSLWSQKSAITQWQWHYGADSGKTLWDILSFDAAVNWIYGYKSACTKVDC